MLLERIESLVARMEILEVKQRLVSSQIGCYTKKEKKGIFQN
jgi:hypothetical protein